MTITLETIQSDQAWKYVEQTLYNTVAKQAQLDTGINLFAISSETNGQGVYTMTSTKDDEYPVHYFRGDVDNNNVIFGEYCWKIVRTTETGGVKLIYNGEPTNDGRCIATGEDTQLGPVGMNWESPAYAGYMYNTVYEYNQTNMIDMDEVVYGNSFEYKDGKYILKDTVSYSSWDEAYNKLSNHHYTCFNDTGVCDENFIAYIYNTDTEDAYYLGLEDGTSIEDALNDMLWSEDVNKVDSINKAYIDEWYEENMTKYTSYLEDTVWCNDRSVYSLGGFDPNGGSTVGENPFINYGILKKFYTNNVNLNCPNRLDSFTVSPSNGNGALTYPVGQLVSEEVALAGGFSNISNTSYYLFTGEQYWLNTPVHFDEDFMYVHKVNTSGEVGGYSHSSDKYGIRPSISLRYGIDYATGDGTPNTPYIIETMYDRN